MAISYEDKIKKIESIMKFPERVCFYIAKDLEKDELSIYIGKVKDKKKKIRNIRLSELDIIVLGSSVAPIEVHVLDRAEQVIALADRYSAMWHIKDTEKKLNALTAWPE